MAFMHPSHSFLCWKAPITGPFTEWMNLAHITNFTIILPFLNGWKLFLNKIAINKNYGNLTSITNAMSKAYLLLYILQSIPLGSMLNHFYNNGSETFYHSSVTKVTGYRLDDWSSIACRNRDISLLHHVQTDSAINPLGTGGIFCFM